MYRINPPNSKRIKKQNKINLKSYLAPSTKLFYHQQKVIQKAKAERNNLQDQNIKAAIHKYVEKGKKKRLLHIQETKKSPTKKQYLSSVKDPLWVRLKSAQMASYALVEKRAIDDTKKALEAFQQGRFNDGSDIDDKSDIITNYEDGGTSSPPKLRCHSSNILDEIHGYWQDQENITLLRRITGFSATELRRLFLNFKSLCSLSSTPYGLTYHTFCNTIPTFTFEDPLFTNRVFEFFDSSERGLWRWEEYLLCMALLFKTCKVLKIFFLFKLYDVNNDGTISKDEMCHFFIKSLVVEVDAHLLELCQTHIDALFRRIDEDEDGEISLEETLLYVENHPEIDDIYGIFGRTIALPNLQYDKNSNELEQEIENDEANLETKYEKWKRENETENIAATHCKRDIKLFKAIKTGEIDLNILWEQLSQSINVGTNKHARERIDAELSRIKMERGKHHEAHRGRKNTLNFNDTKHK
jgi:neuronal calcium sensor 1